MTHAPDTVTGEPSGHFSATASARSQLFQLLALAFVHPVAPFHEILSDGSYPLAVVRAARAADGMHTSIVQPQQSFAAYEADYIHVFQVGKRGQPIVHLNAGDYAKLLGSGSRPEFLLEYSGWYRHFGLKTNEDDRARELPDHIACQLEFLAWLAHLEHRAADDSELQQGYACAQRDFCERHLQQFLRLLITALQKENARHHVLPITAFFLSLSTLALEIVTALQHRFDKILGESAARIHDPDQIVAVNLWG